MVEVDPRCVEADANSARQLGILEFEVYEDVLFEVESHRFDG